MSSNNDNHKEQRIGLWLVGSAATLSVLITLFYAIWGWETGKIEGSPDYGKTASAEMAASMNVEQVASEVITPTTTAPIPMVIEASAITTISEPKTASETVASSTNSTPTIKSASEVTAPSVSETTASSPATVILADTAPADADTAQVVVAENGVVKFYFAIGKADLAKGAQTALKDVLEGVKAGKKAVISGYHDSTGNAAQNQELSKQRAFAVRDALLRFGVPENQIELRKPENTEAGKSAEARRVEVVLE